MPISSKRGKKQIIRWVEDTLIEINSVLDVGCGVGTYLQLFKEDRKILSNSAWTGVEVWTPYIEKYKLKDRYNLLINCDVRLLDYNNLGTFDLCFLGDVLEHMSKEESLDVVTKILKISKYVIISIPIVHYPQAEVENNPYEIHVKDDWSDSEVKDTFPYIIDHRIDNDIGVYLLSNN